MPRAFLLNLTFVCTATFAFCLFPSHVLLPSNFLLAQTRPRTPHDFPRLREWLSAIDRHEPGAMDAAAIAVGSWQRDQLDVLFLDVRTLVLLISATGGPMAVGGIPGFTHEEFRQLQLLALQVWPSRANRLRTRGALLHADIAMLLPP